MSIVTHLMIFTAILKYSNCTLIGNCRMLNTKTFHSEYYNNQLRYYSIVTY